jgi:RNase P/RNase MRP subunit p29
MILIGKVVKIIQCSQQGFIGRSFRVIDETQNTLVLCVDEHNLDCVIQKQNPNCCYIRLTKQGLVIETGVFADGCNITTRSDQINKQNRILIDCTGKKVQW